MAFSEIIVIVFRESSLYISLISKLNFISNSTGCQGFKDEIAKKKRAKETQWVLNTTGMSFFATP